MNLEFAITVDNGVVKLKITTPEMPVVIETAAQEPGTVTAVQKENVSAVTKAASEEDKVKAEISVLSEKLISMNRQYERVKKAAYRAGKRLEENLKGLGQGVAAAGNNCPQSAVAGCPQPADNLCPTDVPSPVPRVPNPVPGDSRGQGQAVTAYCNTNTINHNHIIDYDTDQSRCLPFMSEDNHCFIPLAKLPEMYQKILTAWNDLPLPEKLKGLYPDMAQKLHNLLKEYGEAAVQKAIHMVTESPFLLGKVTNTRGWKHIYFGWLLNPQNMKKVLANNYQDRNKEQYQGYECVTYPEYIPWDDEKVTAGCAAATVTVPKQEECSAHNTAQPCYLDPEYMLNGLDPLTDQARSCLCREAALLGLTKVQAA